MIKLRMKILLLKFKNFRELPDDEKDFLPPGFQITKPKQVEEGSGKFNLPKKNFLHFSALRN